MSLQEFTVEVEAPASGSGLLRISVSTGTTTPSNSAASRSIRYTFDSSVPVIDRVGLQNIIVDTDFVLSIGITNNPDTVTVEGVYESFYYDRDAATVEIRGTPNNLSFGESWTVKAVKGSIIRTRSIRYNVVPAAPIISLPDVIEVYRNFDNTVSIPVANRPSTARIEGLLLGLTGTLAEGEEIVDGSVPPISNFTRNEGEIKVRSENVSGVDEVRGIMPRVTRITMSADGVRS